MDPVVQVNFQKLPPFRTNETARKKIFDLSNLHWGETVTLKAISALFDQYLDYITSSASKTADANLRAKKCEVSVPLKVITTLLNSKYLGTEEWKIAHNLALRALGTAHWLEAVHVPYQGEHPFINLYPDAIMKKIFFEIIETDNENLRGVCRKWRRCANEAWNDFTKDDYWQTVNLQVPIEEALNGIKTFQGLHSRTNLLDLRHVEDIHTTKILGFLPHLQGLKTLSKDALKFNVEFFCPDLKELVISEYYFRGEMLDLTGLKKLISINLDGFWVEGVQFPSSIEEITLKGGSQISLDFFEVSHATVKHLIIEKCEFDEILDLTGPCWKNLESLTLKECESLEEILFNPRYEKLRMIKITRCNELGHLDLSEISFPELEVLIVKSTNLVTLPSRRMVPKLQTLDVIEIEQAVNLDLELYSSVIGACFKGLLIQNLTLPHSIISLILRQCEINHCTISNELPHLKYLEFADVMGLPGIVSLINSSQLEICTISHVEGLGNLILPQSIELLQRLNIYQEHLLNIEGLMGTWNQLDELYLSASPLLGFDTLDLEEASNLKFLYINYASELQTLTLPYESEILESIELKNILLEAIDLRRYPALEVINLDPLKKCNAFFAKEYANLNEIYFTKKVSHNLSLKRQRTKV